MLIGAAAFACSGMVLNAVMSLPQALRGLRAAPNSGMSATTWALSAACAGSWCVYGAAAPVAEQIPGNALMLFGALTVLHVTGRRGTQTIRAWIVLVSCICAATLVFWLAGVRGIGWFAFAIGAARSVPQLFVAVLSPVIDGLSTGTWLLTVAASLSWLCYGLVAHNVTIGCSAGTGLLMAAAIVIVARIRDT